MIKGGGMKKIVLCVPNISEGRDKKKIAAIVSAAEIPGVKILDVSSDINHNRTVITFAGRPEAVKQAAFNLIKEAAKLIDMAKHKGEHPRMGAVDVCPFVPVTGMTMEECVKLARGLGQSVERQGLSGYFYGYAATGPERKKLSDIRAGEYEALPKKLEKPEWFPDFGLSRFNPKFGAVVIGARDFLVAFNVNLKTSDLNLAKNIARMLRATGGTAVFGPDKKTRVVGIFPTVQAVDIDTRDQGYVQISMNLLNYKVDSVIVVFETTKRICELVGVGIHSSEIIGLVPRDALKDMPLEYLQLKDFDPKKQIIEEALGL